MNSGDEAQILEAVADAIRGASSVGDIAAKLDARARQLRYISNCAAYNAVLSPVTLSALGVARNKPCPLACGEKSEPCSHGHYGESTRSVT